MSESSAIEWTDATWNPVLGCTHVSEGCDNCYAAREASGRLSGHPLYAGLARNGKFTGEVRLVPERLEDPLRWRRPRLVFVNSMSDLFHDAVPDEFIARVFAVMAAAHQHIFQVLTKRPARMRSLLSDRDFIAGLAGRIWRSPPQRTEGRVIEPWYPLPNVWLGTSVETQKWADVRIPKLLETPAAVRFLSCEPLLGPLDLNLVPIPIHGPRDLAIRQLDWVIVGGESGPGARPMHPEWARDLLIQCLVARVPFFFKQWGEWAPAGYEGTHLLHVNGSLVDRAGATQRVPLNPSSVHTRYQDVDLVHRGHPGWVRVRRVGKRAAGRQLDGRLWDQMPKAVA